MILVCRIVGSSNHKLFKSTVIGISNVCFVSTPQARLQSMIMKLKHLERNERSTDERRRMEVKGIMNSNEELKRQSRLVHIFKKQTSNCEEKFDLAVIM